MSTTTESELVVSFVSDFMSSYAHIKNHKGRGTQIGSQFPKLFSNVKLCPRCLYTVMPLFHFVFF